MAPASPLPAPAPQPRLAGDLAIWLVVAMETATFGLLFLAFAGARALAPQRFAQGQAFLHVQAGACNTAWLVVGSWCVARAVRAAAIGAPGPDRSRPLRAWLLGALACGAGFLVLKTREFAEHLAQGHDLQADTFWTLYWLLTGFHWAHVLAATLFLAVLLALGLRRPDAPGLHALETGAAFWHMVDLLWLILFPLVYVTR